MLKILYTPAGRGRGISREIMKQNTFYLIIGIIGILELLCFWTSIQLSNPFIIAIAFLAGAVIYFVLRRHVSDRYVDERQNLIDMKTASATLKVFWVSFFSVNLAVLAYVFSVPLGLNKLGTITFGSPSESHNPGVFQHLNDTGFSDQVSQVAITVHSNVTDVAGEVVEHVPLFTAPPEMIAISHLGTFCLIQTFLLLLMMFIYVGFRVYYSHKFGEWDDDEE